MNGIPTGAGQDGRSPAGNSSETPVDIMVTLHPAVAYQLAQFAKRSTFDTFYDFTEAHLSNDERKQRAYQMIAGIEAVGAALAKIGYAPR